MGETECFFGHNIARGSGGDDGMNPKPNKKNVLRSRILRNYCLQGLFYTVPSSFVLHCSNYKLTLGASGITFTGINPNTTFPQMNIANVQEGGLTLRNQTLDLTLFSKKSFTICVVMQLWLNRSMSIKTIIGNGAYEKPHLIYDRTTKKLKLQTSGDDGEDSFTVLNSFNGKRVVFWPTKKGAGFRLVVKASICNHSAT